ncbi:MAG: LysR substrate-binding domain-containing protein [Alphaproteobacteria bacterium]|nr:LysR substrate-binding domain-containing protein [Alphaproteobacteria bacterium]
MLRPLPPLNALKAFEAAGRLGSLAAAADELGVTHGAVSRQVRLLEDWLGRPLFTRSASRIALTVDGKSFLADVGQAFTTLTLATARYLDRTPRAVFRVNAPHTFMMRWLMPRARKFQHMHPGIEIALDASSQPVETLPGRFDAAIRRQPMTLSGFKSTPFLTEQCVPVISPALAARIGLRDPADLAGHTLLHSRSRPALWPDWLALAGGRHVRPIGELHLDGLMLSIEAAAHGLGVAIGPSALVADDIASGRLIAPIAAPRLVLEPFRVMVPADPIAHPAAIAFRDWLVETAEREGGLASIKGPSNDAERLE